MSAQHEIERFGRDVASSEAFREELKVFGSDPEAVVRHANAKGYDFTYSDLTTLVPLDGQLSDSQLEGVAGGLSVLWDRRSNGSGTLLVGTESGGCIYMKGHPGSIDNLLAW